MSSITTLFLASLVRVLPSAASGFQSGHSRAAQSHFFLDGESRQQVHVCRRVLHQLNQVKHTQAVIQRLATQGRANHLEMGGKGATVPDLGLTAPSGAKIHAQLVGAKRLLAFVGRCQMDGLGANHARNMIAADHDALAGQLALIHAAHHSEFKDTVAFIIHQHEADLIHVRRDHHAQPVFCRAVACDQQVAQRIRLH